MLNGRIISTAFPLCCIPQLEPARAFYLLRPCVMRAVYHAHTLAPTVGAVIHCNSGYFIPGNSAVTVPLVAQPIEWSRCRFGTSRSWGGRYRQYCWPFCAYCKHNSIYLTSDVTVSVKSEKISDLFFGKNLYSRLMRENRGKTYIEPVPREKRKKRLGHPL